MAGAEKGRNEIQIGGGYSGADGAFFTGLYSTKNFLGRGQVVSLSLQLGGAANLYQIAFQEPWFLNRPYTLGFTLFRGDQDYGAAQRSQSRGFGVMLGRQIGYFQSVQLRYDFQKVKSNGLQPQNRLRDRSRHVDAVDRRSSRRTRFPKITPQWCRNGINDPYRPAPDGRSWPISRLRADPWAGTRHKVSQVKELPPVSRSCRLQLGLPNIAVPS